MIKLLDMTNLEVVEAVLKLQWQYYDIPPLKDTLESLASCDEIFYGCIIENDIAGIIAYKVVDAVLDIHRMAIHPNYFRGGIASQLIKCIESIESDCTKIEVCTGRANTPAKELYLKSGFKIVKDVEVSVGLTLTMFEKSYQ
jgi:ribosomal protein S18 acetylase RimI-like enzyme